MQKLLHNQQDSAPQGILRKNLNRLPIRLLLLIGIFLFWLPNNLAAQTTTISTESGTNFTGGNGVGGNSAITFVVENTNTFDIILTGVDAYFQTASNGTIPTLWYSATSLSGTIPTPGISSPIWTSISTGSPVTVAANGYVPVFTNLSFVIPAGTQYRFALQSTIDIRYSGTSPVPSPSVLSGGGVNLKVYDAVIGGSAVGYGGAFPSPPNSPRAFTGRIHFMPALPCVAPPNGGQAVASSPTACSGANFQLSLTGASGGQGMTYQWQSSPNGTTGWTNVTGATNANVTVSQTATTFYRAQLTCSTQTATSLPVQVTTPALIPASTFTINKNNPTSGTNFQSITAAVNHISCGISGPITFNVVAGTGPYTEHVIMPQIFGVSATNRITFNGNGNTLSATPTTADPGAITLNGTDFVTISNLTITLDAAATSGWGIQLKNEANNVIISNNTINLPLTSTSSVYNGIIAGTATATAGNNASNLTISGNTINGGYYGINLNGNTGGVNGTNNQALNNLIRDPYFYGIYLNHQTSALIEGNDISRPARTNGGTLYGIYVTGLTTSTIVSKNRYHNTHDVASSLTGTVYGFFSTGADAPVGSENIYRNNLMYNINNTGEQYGIYNSSSDGHFYYHNTIDLNSPNNTSLVRGFYQITAATNIKLMNNIIAINSGSSGAKHVLYFGTTTSAIDSDRNGLFLSGGAATSGIGFFTSNRVTLADWRTASGDDANSVSADPQFANRATGNLTPTSGAINNIGAPVTPPVADDITGAPRSATTPDPGAYEFTPSAIDAGVIAIVSPVSGCGKTATENVVITVQNFGTASQSNIPVTYTINGGTPVTGTVPGPIASGATVNFTFPTPANLSAVNTYTIVASTNLAGDALAANNATTKVVTSIPTVATFPYFQNFDAGAGGWVAGGTNSSWALGTPAGTVINSAASGTNSWMTNLTGFYNNSENSQVVSPCFNMSSLVSPIIEFKIWWVAEASWDGMVLQSSIDGGATWQKVGAFGDPNNWYNDNTINGAPGGQPAATAEGWTGGTASSTPPWSGGWVTAKHDLTGLGGQSSVLLRFAFGSDGSVNTYDGVAFDDVSIFETPNIDVGVTAIVTPISGCGKTSSENVTITVRNFGIAPVSNIPVTYTINGGTPVTGIVPGPIAAGANANFTFTTPANLSVVNTYTFVATTNLAGDGNPNNNSTTKVITSIPTISALPYSQNFENGPGGWVAGGTSSSWALGTPAKTVINSAASGTNAWVTSLTGQYNASEQSFVQGPCFNFAGVADPDFEMKVWWNSEFSWDGAVLQSSIDGGATWQKVGAFNDPNNWYNDNTINGGPGGQPAATAEGWTGRVSSGNGSNGWVLAKHKLNGLGGQSSVLLRIAFGADGSVQDDGFAFDDIRIGDNTGNLSVNSFVALPQICGFTNSEKVEVVIENLGSTAAAAGSYTMEYRVDNAPTWISQPGVALAPGTPTNFIFTSRANLSAPGAHTIEVRLVSATDPDLSNNQVTYNVSNATLPAIPATLDFETPATGIGAMRTITRTRSAVYEDTGASNGAGTKGMIMDGVDHASWIAPIGVNNPWTTNPDHFSAAYVCFDPSAGPAKDSLFIIFDLKQLYKGAASSTNFRVTVNGTQIGSTYTPPFGGPSTPWQRIRVDLTPYMNLTGIQIGLESSVKEGYQNGTGTANLIDNIIISRRTTGLKSDILAGQISIMPNPSNGIFQVKAPFGKYSIEITDMTGRTVLKQNATAAETQLNLKDAAKGIYMLQISSEAGMAVKRLVIE